MRGLTLLLVVACHDDDACAGFDPRELAACRPNNGASISMGRRIAATAR